MQPAIRRSPVAIAAIRSEINVTPLVDVCLVLLIVFMLVTPMIRGMHVELPQTEAPAAMPETPHQLTLVLAADGRVFVGGAIVPADHLSAVLQVLHDQDPNRPVVVDGDENVEYGKLAVLLSTARSAGFGRVGLAALKRRL
jgi:biopolymer transport protein TolR